MVVKRRSISRFQKQEGKVDGRIAWKILIVEDDTALRNSVKTPLVNPWLLGRRGACTGEEALTMVYAPPSRQKQILVVAALP